MMGRVTETAGAALVWLRALVLSAVALVAGSVAHVGAHGALPAPVVLVALLALGTTGVAPLLRRPAGTARVVLLLVAGQVMVHAALTALGGHHDESRSRTRCTDPPSGSHTWPRTSPPSTP